MSEFILRHLVREVLRESEEADPGKLAEAVLARIPRGQIRAALGQTLRLYVRQVVSEERVSNSPAVTPIYPHVPARTDGLSRPERPTRSAKVSAIRDGWQKRLRDRVHVGSSEWKFLGDCTYDDLLAAATERRQLSDQNAAWARTYDAWARLLNEHEVETFADLPAEAQMQALGRAA